MPDGRSGCGWSTGGERVVNRHAGTKTGGVRKEREGDTKQMCTDLILCQRANTTNIDADMNRKQKSRKRRRLSCVVSGRWDMEFTTWNGWGGPLVFTGT